MISGGGSTSGPGGGTGCGLGGSGTTSGAGGGTSTLPVKTDAVQTMTASIIADLDLSQWRVN